jgi:hypothetical protein
MKEMSRASPNAASRISSSVLLIIFITLALSLIALILAITSFSIGNEVVAGYLLLAGFIGVAVSGYVLLQTRRRIMRLRIETSPITTTIECKKCGFKSSREFQRGDYVFKELEPCQKCNDKMMITAIYREAKEKGREPSSP